MAKNKLIRSRYNPPQERGERNCGHVITEQTGFIPVKTRIKQYQDAGMRLDQYRHALYHGMDGEIPDDFEDITLRPNLDLADTGEVEEKAKKIRKKHLEAAQLAAEAEIAMQQEKSPPAAPEAPTEPQEDKK